MENYGYRKASFADPIKELLNGFFGWSPSEWAARDWKELPFIGSQSRRADARCKSPRQFAQWLGTEVGRNTFSENVWVDALFKTIDPDQPTVITDVRFENEAARVLNNGGEVWQVYNPKVVSRDEHISESGVRGRFITTQIINAGTVDDLKAYVRRRMEAYL